MAFEPVVQSLLDTDLYKFTMWQPMLHRHPETKRAARKPPRSTDAPQAAGQKLCFRPMSKPSEFLPAAVLEPLRPTEAGPLFSRCA
jgi:hypothetical protein